MLQCVTQSRAPRRKYEEIVMNTQVYDQWLEASRASMAPLMRWNEIATQSAEKCARYGLAVTQDCLDIGTRQLQLLGEVKDPQKWAVESSKL
ncbi:MAG: phasin family protein, partial [Gammaproteobacteria bacterium]|nr:phasin family protein [Gammaproteobacteria bacterium]